MGICVKNVFIRMGICVILGLKGRIEVWKNRYLEGKSIICPIEVKSGNYRGHKSLDVFCDKFRSRICEKYVVHTKDCKRENGISYIPVYMVPFL